MTTPLLTNFAESVLQTQIGLTDTTLSIDSADASKFPAPGVNESFKIILWDGVNDPEICEVTARANEVFTIVRAQEGTAARVWDAYAQVKHALTAAAFDYFLAAVTMLKGTSVTSHTITTGSKEFETQENKLFDVGQWLLVASDADPTSNWMHGQVTSYAADSVIINVTGTNGAGTFSDWTIMVSGPQGTAGSDGAAGAAGAQGAAGEAGIPGINGKTIRNGAGAPSAALGVDGDFYIDTSAVTIYGPKSGGAWGSATNILGAAGATGSSVGIRWNFSTTITDSDPGDGNIRFNHGTFLSITQLFIDNLDASGVDQTAWLDRMDDSTNSGDKGTIRVQEKNDDSVFAEFQVTGAVTDGTGYRKVPVTPLSGAIPTDATQLVAYFAMTGDAGSTFVGLSDTPANFTGAASKVATVNSGETALEFLSKAEWGVAELGTVVLRQVTDNTQLVIADKGKTVEVNAATAKTVTLPANATEAIDINAWGNIESVQADVTVQADSGVTLNGVSTGSIVIGAYESCFWRKSGTNAFIIPNREAV